MAPFSGNVRRPLAPRQEPPLRPAEAAAHHVRAGADYCVDMSVPYILTSSTLPSLPRPRTVLPTIPCTEDPRLTHRYNILYYSTVPHPAQLGPPNRLQRHQHRFCLGPAPPAAAARRARLARLARAPFAAGPQARARADGAGARAEVDGRFDSIYC